MTTEDEHHEENDTSPADEDLSTEDMKAFLQSLNRFVHEVATMDWPDHFELDKNDKFCFSVFRSFWRQRHRQSEQRDGNRRFHMRFQGADADDVRRFMREKFGHMFGHDHESLNIDPEDHQPDEDHIDDEAKERQKRFRDEWE